MGKKDYLKTIDKHKISEKNVEELVENLINNKVPFSQCQKKLEAIEHYFKRYDLVLNYFMFFYKMENSINNEVSFKKIIVLLVKLNKCDDAIKFIDQHQEKTKTDKFNCAKIYLHRITSNYEKAILFFESLKNPSLGCKHEVIYSYIIKKDYEKVKKLLKETQIISDNLANFFINAIISYKENDIEKLKQQLKYLTINTPHNKKIIHDLIRLRVFVEDESLDSDLAAYHKKQLNCYNEKRAVRHIIESRNEDEDIEQYIDLSNLEFIKEEILKSNPVKISTCDIYNLSFNKYVGKIKKIETNILKVVTICDSTDILTIFPIDCIANLKYLENCFDENFIANKRFFEKEVKCTNQRDKQLKFTY